MKEKETYRKLHNFLKEKGFEIAPSSRYKFGDIGQKWIEFDVTAYKDDTLWIIECKRPCTLEQFGFALGQLMCYKFLVEIHRRIVEEHIGKPIKRVMCSITLMETEQYRLSDGLLNTFKEIMNTYGVSFGLLTIDEKISEPKEHIKIEETQT